MQQRLYWPPVTDNVLRLLAVFVVAFLVERIGIAFFQADSARLMLWFGRDQFHPLQLVTHVFSTGPTSFFGALLPLFFEGLVLWMFGSELEREWGSHNFLKMFLWGVLGGILAGAACAAFLPTVLHGFGAGTAAVLIAYAMIWPDRQALLFFVVPVRMKWLVLIIFVLLCFGDFPNQFILQSGGALAGALFVYYYARKGRSSSRATGGFAGTTGASGAATGAGPLGLLQEGMRKRRLAKKQAEINRRIDIKTEVDRLLEKISREGMDSLSRKEKKFLDQASKEF